MKYRVMKDLLFSMVGIDKKDVFVKEGSIIDVSAHNLKISILEQPNEKSGMDSVSVTFSTIKRLVKQNLIKEYWQVK